MYYEEVARLRILCTNDAIADYFYSKNQLRAGEAAIQREYSNSYLRATNMASKLEPMGWDLANQGAEYLFLDLNHFWTFGGEGPTINISSFGYG